MSIRLSDLIRGSRSKTDGYSRALQAARVRAAYQRSYFAPALFSLDSRRDRSDRQHGRRCALAALLQRRLARGAHRRGERDAADPRGQPSAARPRGAQESRRRQGPPALEHRRRLRDQRRSARRRTAAARRSAAARQVRIAEREQRRDLLQPAADAAAERTVTRRRSDQSPSQDCGSGAHGERRFWELPADDGADGGVPGVDRSRPSSCGARWRGASTRRRHTTATCRSAWRRWARATLAPKVDYMATIRHAVRRALARQHARPIRPHLQAAASPAGLLRRVHHAELLPAAAAAGFPDRHLQLDGGLAAGESRLRTGRADASARLRRRRRRRVLRRGRARGEEGVRGDADRVVRRRRHGHRRGLRAFIERKSAPIDLLVIVSDCRTPWPEEAPPFPVITIRVGDGAPPPWGNHGANRVITIEEPAAPPIEERPRRRWS